MKLCDALEELLYLIDELGDEGILMVRTSNNYLRVVSGLTAVKPDYFNIPVTDQKPTVPIDEGMII